MKLFENLFWIFCLVFAAGTSHAQILNTDNLGRNNDTTRFFNGTWEIAGKASRVKTTIVNIRNKGLLNFYMKKQELIASTTFNMLYSDDQMLLNGGHVHLRYRRVSDRRIIPESFTQIQWDGARGMEHRYLLGQNLKIQLIKDSTFNFSTGFGLMFENEAWNHDGVPAARMPLEPLSRSTSNYIKFNLILSLKKQFKNGIFFSLVSYLQTRPDSFYGDPRIAGDALLNLPLGKRLFYSISYNWVYDSRPIVPINKMYYILNNGLKLNF